MAERGILFSTAMVRALLRKVDPKTHTRRTAGLETINKNPDNWDLVYEELGVFYFEPKDKHCIACMCKPRYNVGDILYIKETWSPKDSCVAYKADLTYKCGKDCPQGIELVTKWHSSMFMFKKDARPNRYEVVSVNPQRINTLTDEQAMDEGMDENVASYLGISMMDYSKDGGNYYLHIFKRYWDFLNAKSGHPFYKGDWVWDYGFREVKI
jgi:hypothetical protein